MRVSLASFAVIVLLLQCVTSSFTLTSAASITGRLQSLNGEGEKGVTVVATRTDAAASATPITAVSDANGEYTLEAASGTYEISVQLSGSASATSADASASAARLLRATPARSTVSVAAAPIKHVDFVVFRRPSKFDLSGEVVGLGEGLKHAATLEVQIALASNPTAVVHKTTLLAKALPYFEFTNLPSDTYIVTVKTSLNPRTYSFTSASVTVSLTASAHIQPVVEISYKMSSVHEMQSNSIWHTVLLLAIVAALMNKDKSVVLGKALLKSAQTRNPSHVRNAIASFTTSASGNAAASFAPVEDVSKSSNKDKKSKFPAKKEKTHVSTFVRYDSLPASERPQPPVEVAAPAPAPVAAPKPVAKPTPAPAPAAAKRAHTPAPPMEKEKPAPAPAAVKKPAPPAAAPAPVPSVVKPTPVAAPPAAAPAVSTSGGVKFCPECGAKRENAAAKFCVECGHKF